MKFWACKIALLAVLVGGPVALAQDISLREVIVVGDGVDKDVLTRTAAEIRMNLSNKVSVVVFEERPGSAAGRVIVEVLSPEAVFIEMPSGEIRRLTVFGINELPVRVAEAIRAFGIDAKVSTAVSDSGRVPAKTGVALGLTTSLRAVQGVSGVISTVGISVRAQRRHFYASARLASSTDSTDLSDSNATLGVQIISGSFGYATAGAATMKLEAGLSTIRAASSLDDVTRHSWLQSAHLGGGVEVKFTEYMALGIEAQLDLMTRLAVQSGGQEVASVGRLGVSFGSTISYLF